MILIQRYIFKELVYNFAFAFVVITLIMLLGMAVQVVFKFPVLGVMMVIKFIPLMITESLSRIIPAAALVSTVMTYGRVSSDNEIVTLRASGIHVLRIAIPGVILGLMASLALLVINDILTPHATKEMKRMMKEEVDLDTLLDTAIRKGAKKLELSQYLIIWDSCEKVEGKTEGGINTYWRFSGLRLKIYDKETKKELQQEILAETGNLHTNNYNKEVWLQVENFKMLKGPEVEGERVTIRESLEVRRKSKVRLSMRRFDALSAILQRDPRHRVYPDFRVSTELNKRIADSIGPLVFVLLSLPIAILFRQQNRMVAFLISILIAFFIYYPITLVGANFANEGELPPVLGIWAGNVLLLAIGIVMILKVMRK